MTTATFERGLIWLSYLINIAVVGSWLYSQWARYLKRRTVRRFFGGDRLTVYLPIRDLDGRRAIAEPDFAAAVELAEFVGIAGVQSEFRFVEPDGSVDLTADALVVICGPKTSTVVEEAMATDPDLRFEQDAPDWVISDLHDQRRYRSPMDHGVPGGDVAYVARSLRRPGTERTFIAIAGIHAAGSAGAVHYFTNYRNLRQVHRRTSGNRLFSACIESEFRNDPLRVVDSVLVVLHVRSAPSACPRMETVVDVEGRRARASEFEVRRRTEQVRADPGPDPKRSGR